MHAPRNLTSLAAGVLLLLWSAATPAVERGEPLAAALEELRAHGLQLVFSSALVRAELTVDVDPGDGAADEVARRILASHGLTLKAIRPGLYSVVKAETGSSSRAAARDPSASTRSAVAVDEPIYEVGVYASRYRIDQSAAPSALAELSREEVETLPGLDQDVLRVTRFLPGTASNALSARSHVRGGRDNELAVFFDGVPLYEPFHYKDVQSLLGMLDPGSISKIDFFSGVMPARYGNRLSGVLDIAPRKWAGENYNEVGASVLYTHALTQGRLESYPVEWLGSVRRGNIGAVGEIAGHEAIRPDFLDTLARVQLDTGPRSSVAAGWLLLDDSLRINLREGSEIGDFEYRDATGWGSWTFRPSDASEMRATFARTERHTTREGTLDRAGSASGALDDRRHFDTTSLRLEGAGRLSDRVLLSAGLEWYDYHAEFDYSSTSSVDPFLAAVFNRPVDRSMDVALDVTGEAYAAYTSTLLTLSPRVSLDLALRWDAQRFGTAFRDSQVSPRLSAQYAYDADTVLRVSWGRMAQTERPDELQVQDGNPAFDSAQRSNQTVVSLERRIRDSALLRIEAYDRYISSPVPLYENAFDPFALLPELEPDRIRVAPDRSRVYGAELSVRWQLMREWSGWMSYSWSEATDHFGPVGVLRTWDQKHSVATGLAWARRPWLLSGNLNWHSGWRRNALDETSTGFELAPRNSRAWPASFSLDLRAQWTRALPKGALEVFAEIDNATNHGNSCCVSYTVQTTGGASALSPETSTWLPRLYLVGVTWQLP